nr:lipid II flippase MurJ [Hasllibacter sp. MH4015]
MSLQFGAGQQTDAYFIANAIPGFVFGGVLATIGLVFLPIYRKALAEGEGSAALSYRTAVVSYVGLSFALACVTFFAADRIVDLIAEDRPETTRQLAVTMTRIMAFGFVFTGWVGLQNSLLQTHKSLVWPQLVPLLNHLFVILGLAVAALVGGSIIIMVVAAVLGWVIMAPLSAIKARPLWPRAPSASFDPRIAMSIAALSLPVFLSTSFDQASILIGTALASAFSDGAVSHLNYAMRLAILLSSVFSLIVAYVLFPYLTESVVARRDVQARRYVLQALVVALGLSAPLFVLCLLRGEDFVSFVFRRGAFDAADAAAAGGVITYLSPIVLLFGIREVLNRLFLAQQRTRALLLFGLIGMAVNVGASVLLSRSMGIEGIALGASLGVGAYVSAQTIALLMGGRNYLDRFVLIWSGIIATAIAVAGGLLELLDPVLTPRSARLDFLLDAGIVTLGIAASLGLAWVASAGLRRSIGKDG